MILLTVPACRQEPANSSAVNWRYFPRSTFSICAPKPLLCRGDSRDPTDAGSPSRRARHHLKKRSRIDASRALRVHLSHLAARSRSTETGPEASMIDARRAQRAFGDGLISF
jgi:hypothetical protein